MAAKRDYFGLERTVSIILAIIPFTSWICGVLTRLNDGKIIPAVLRIFLGWLTWLFDLFFMVKEDHILRCL